MKENQLDTTLGPLMLWGLGATYKPTSDGKYAVIVTNGGISVCTGNSQIQKQYMAGFRAGIRSAETSYEEKEPFTVIASPASGLKTYVYDWLDDPLTGSGSDHIRSYANVSEDPNQYTIGVVIRDAEDANGLCQQLTSIEILIYGKIDIPNVFTPNGDGEGDYWNLDAIAILPQPSIRVYNRWGNLVYESLGGYAKPWDGTYNGGPAPDGTYFYVIELNDKMIEPNEFSGTVQIMR